MEEKRIKEFENKLLLPELFGNRFQISIKKTWSDGKYRVLIKDTQTNDLAVLTIGSFLAGLDRLRNELWRLAKIKLVNDRLVNVAVSQQKNEAMREYAEKIVFYIRKYLGLSKLILPL